jgi:hypothetical protein
MTGSRWVNDLALGLRLAVGGGRISRSGLVRLVLGTIGAGLAVVVLLFAASVVPALEARNERSNAQVRSVNVPKPGVDPLYLVQNDTQFRGDTVKRTYARAGGPAAPMPPGVDRLPGPGESLVSPALAKLLASPEGELLRPRFPERITGEIGPAGLVQPTTLAAVIGPSGAFDRAVKVDGFGGPTAEATLRSTLLVILTLGLVVLLLPVFVFVASSARIAGAERDRRLAALRLVGSGARQVRRIAAAESLVSAVFGLLLGGALFLLVRSFAADIEIGGVSFFPGDLTPSWPLLLFIIVIVPLLGVLTAQFALRRTIIEPLNLVRQAIPVRRRVAWRLGLIVTGVVMLVSASLIETSVVMIIGGATLVLLSVPILLPWLLERLTARFDGGGGPAFQLAVRRLQLDTGTPSRVVGSLSVVLAGAVALQLVLAGQSATVTRHIVDGDRLWVQAYGKDADQALAAVRSSPDISVDYLVKSFAIEAGGRSSGGVSVADCAMLTRILEVDRCQDGDAFGLSSAGLPVPVLRGTVDVVGRRGPGIGQPAVIGQIELPEQLRETTIRLSYYMTTGSILLTPGALRATPGLAGNSTGMISTSSADAIEKVRNAVEPYSFSTDIISSGTDDGENAGPQTFLEIRKGLLIGSLFTLLLAAMSLLVVAVEQTRERRRSIAALSATGVPLGTLVRSLLWQNAIPIVIAVAIALASGIGLAALTFRLIGMEFTMDWPATGLMAATAGTLILLVTVLTLPTLRSATRLTALRTE